MTRPTTVRLSTSTLDQLERLRLAIQERAGIPVARSRAMELSIQRGCAALLELTEADRSVLMGARDQLDAALEGAS